MIKRMKLKAHGKINLGLDVLRRREDGYHEVKMIMQTVGLYDSIDLKLLDQPGIRVETNLCYLPNNENNLVWKAADLLMREFSLPGGISIRLKKMIPVAAGMAGGSSDAAAVLFGVNRMFGLGLSMEELKKRGVTIGADVPYCLMRGTALSEGIGEILTPLPPAPQCAVLLAKPRVSVSTKWVYTNLNANGLRPEDHPDIDGIAEAIRRGDLREMAGKMGNVLELVTEKRYPVIGDIKAVMKKYGALNAMMSGSGPRCSAFLRARRRRRRPTGRSGTGGFPVRSASCMSRIFSITGRFPMDYNLKVMMNEYLPLRDVVFNTLRQAILKGELEPGERLMEIQLAERLGVSRTPIREAIRKLELEGLVLMIPRKGAEVAKISARSLRDVLEVRRAWRSWPSSWPARECPRRRWEISRKPRRISRRLSPRGMP